MAKGIQVSEHVTGKCPPDCGFPLQDVWQAIEKPDQTHDISWETLAVSLLVRYTPHGADLVILQTKPQALVTLAFRIYPDLFDVAISELAPLVSRGALKPASAGRVDTSQ